jgi:hypothetical protein
VFAEAGIGGLNYVLAACDHEWECRHLWTEGIPTRPSETVRRQMYVNFWFEAEGIKLRHHIGIDNIMWESDFPHVASFYPRSWESIERVRRRAAGGGGCYSTTRYGAAATVSGIS